MDDLKINAVIIGGGIVGLATALELKKAYKDWDIAILESAEYLGDQSTGRNSGVLHAGLYYPTSSQKHLLCLEGIDLWKKDYCPTLNITYQECGKILFSKDKNEEEGLYSIWENAKKNGVSRLKWVSDEKLNEVNSFVRATTAFFSPNTGILDVTGAVRAISNKFEELGGIISKNCEVKMILREHNSYKIQTDDYTIESEIVINCAGLKSTTLRKHLGLNDIDSVYVKGNYVSTSQKLNHPHLFYPVPPKDLKGLGVHSTLDLDGKIKFGPNTEDIDQIDYSDSGSALEMMKPEILKNFKNVDSERLYWDYSGIRSKIKNKGSGKLETDFWIKSPIHGYIECLGIESPGLTSAPAIARMIISKYF